MGRASPPPLPTNPPCAAKAAAPTITAPAASDIHFILPAIFSLPASLHIVETEGLARPDGLGPGMAVPAWNIEKHGREWCKERECTDEWSVAGGGLLKKRKAKSK